MSLKNKGTANYIYELRRLIDLGFNVAELKTLCLDLGLDYDHLAGEQKQAKINELILYMGRRGLLATMRDVLVTERPNFDWPQVPNAEQQTQDITDFETGSTPTGRKLGCVTITFWISGMFTFLTGFAIRPSCQSESPSVRSPHPQMRAGAFTISFRSISEESHEGHCT